jgi:tetratricopeptide (TPR) repeat protein
MRSIFLFIGSSLAVVSQSLEPVLEARALYEQGDAAAATRLLQREIQSGTFSVRPALQRALIYGNLGTLAHEVGDYRLAVHAYRQSLTLCGADVCGVAASNNLAAIYLESGELEQAEREVQSNAKRRLDQFGVNAPEVLRWWGNRGSIEYARDHPKQALVWYRRALDGWIQRGEPNVLDAIIARSNVGLALLGERQYPEAVEHLAIALRAVEAMPHHLQSRLPVALMNLGVAQALAGRPERAAPLLQRAVEEGRQRLGVDHPITAVAMLRRGEFLVRWGDKKEGKRVRQAAVDLLAVHHRDQGAGQKVDVRAFSPR